MTWVCANCREKQDDDEMLDCWNCGNSRSPKTFEGGLEYISLGKAEPSAFVQSFKHAGLVHVEYEAEIRARLQQIANAIKDPPPYISAAATEPLLYSSKYSIGLGWIVAGTLLTGFMAWTAYFSNSHYSGSNPLVRAVEPLFPFVAPLMAMGFGLRFLEWRRSNRFELYIAITEGAFAFTGGKLPLIVPLSSIEAVKQSGDDAKIKLDDGQKLTIDLQCVANKAVLLKLLQVISAANARHRLAVANGS